MRSFVVALLVILVAPSLASAQPAASGAAEPPLVAFFTVDVPAADAGELIEADASRSTGDIVAYAWRWDANASSSSDASFEPGGVTATHRYDAAGVHVVTLRVTARSGAVAFANQSVLVRAGLPEAYIQPDAYEARGSSVHVRVNASFSTPGRGAHRIVKYEWDWGDDASSGGFFEGNETEEHTYSEAGAFLVRLRVTDDLGVVSDVATYGVTVKSTFWTRLALVWEDRASFIEGARVTLILAIGTTVVGFALAVLLALCRISRLPFLKWPAFVYIEVIRGTPLFLQILITWLVLPYFGVHLSVFYAGALALVINTTAYQAEAIRAGIQAIPTGQMEAAISLGMTYVQAMRHIVVPQAFRLSLPALGNEFIILLKDTSLVSVIGVVELTFIGRTFANRTFILVEPFLAVGLVYFVMTYSLATFLRYLEKRLAIPGMGMQGGVG